MIGGTDMVIETTREGFDIRRVLDAVNDLWPDAMLQDAEEEHATPLTQVDGTGSREFFIYKSPESADSWIAHGWTEEHGDDMAHFLVRQVGGQPDSVRITLVIGSGTAEPMRLYFAVSDAITGMRPGAERRSPRPGRIDWDASLKAVGYLAGRQQFYEKVEAVREAAYPGWPSDELACHPSEALQFCDVVRRAVAAPVPDHFVMKALLNRRRQGVGSGVSPVKAVPPAGE